MTPALTAVAASRVDASAPIVEIDAAALLSNLEAIRKRLAAGVRVAAVLKGNAFGHGLDEVASALCDEVDLFAVVELADALRLADRYPGRVFLMSPVYGTELASCIERGIQVSVSRSEAVPWLTSDAAVHLLVDTGLRRLGIEPDSAVELARAIAASGASLESAYCHVAGADRGAWNDVEREVGLLRALDLGARCWHAGGSSLAIERPDLVGGIARPGIALYGLYPNDSQGELVSLRPALLLRAPVLEIREVSAGDPIGYGGRRSARAMRLATLMVGVSHGLSPALADGGVVTINQNDCRVLAISLELAVVDVTDAPDVARGDDAVVMGGAIDGPTGIRSIARRLGLIPDHVLAPLSRGLERRLVNRPNDAV